MNTIFFDKLDIKDAKRHVTDEGYLVVEGYLARTGVQNYYAYELGLTDRSPLSVVKLFRPAEEVFQKDSLLSFENKPITIGHPPELVDSKNWSTYAKGVVDTIRKSGDQVLGVLTIKSQDAIDEVDLGLVQLSNGYTCTIDMTSGVTPAGLAFDAVQRNIRGNHVALVKNARCGSACSIGDSNNLTLGVDTMKVNIKGIPFEVADASAAAAIEQLVADNASLTAEIQASKEKNSITFKVGNATVTHTGDDVAKMVAGYESTIADLEKDVITPDKRDALVADWVRTLDSAKKLDPKLETKGKTCLQIRKDSLATILAGDTAMKPVALAILAGKEVKDADESIIRMAFDAVSAIVPSTKAEDSTFANAIVDTKTVATDSVPALTGRDKFMENQKSGFASK